MRFIHHVSHISMDFLKEESGSSFMAHVLLGALIAVVCTLLILALKKDS